MYQRVLMPLDGSKLAEQVIPYALQFRAALGSRLEFLQVIEAPYRKTEDTEYLAYLDNAMSTMQTEAEGYQEELAGSMRERGVAVSWDVRQGDPTTVITQVAEEEPATLIAMTSHGRSGQTRWWLGSTTDRVSHATTCPLLIVRSREQITNAPPVQFTHCTVPLDGSERAEKILPAVLAIARAFGSEVILVQVVPEVDSHFWQLFPGAYEEDREGQAKQYLETIREKLQQQGLSNTEIRLLHGHPASVLADFVWEIPDNLIVMATHGLGGSGRYRWTVGSVTQRVVGSAGAPVLVVRVPETESS